MLISILIVNYNSKYFLEQCLHSVKSAIEHLSKEEKCNPQELAEVFVVDNNSTDGSKSYLPSLFPWVSFTFNDINVGFAKANNQALQHTTGEYVVFLNPDTIVAEDTFLVCVKQMSVLPLPGAIGVRMLNGNGIFLKESKRAFPTPTAGLYKLFGFEKLFPRSNRFASYYAGNAANEKNVEVDILSGAFFFVKKDVIVKTGSFDDRFFMYGEDIDLSYRITLAGFHNYYIGETTIIHFKGESTIKDRRYIDHFYAAMTLFADKYFKTYPAFYRSIIKMGIRTRKLITKTGNYFTVSKNPPGTTREKLFLVGDISKTKELKHLLQKSETVTENKEEATQFIYCEGMGLTFKNIISMFEENAGQKSGKIHAGGSNSVVGNISFSNGSKAIETT